MVLERLQKEVASSGFSDDGVELVGPIGSAHLRLRHQEADRNGRDDGREEKGLVAEARRQEIVVLAIPSSNDDEDGRTTISSPRTPLFSLAALVQ